MSGEQVFGCFEVAYIGTVTSDADLEMESCLIAVQKAIDMDNKKTGFLHISNTSIKVLDKEQSHIVKEDHPSDVTYVFMNPKNSKLVGYKTLEPGLDNMVLCHVFMCAGQSRGVDIATALQGSFQSASGTSRKVENNKRNASSVASQTKSGADALGTFDGIYVGKVPVTKEDGDDVVKDAVKRLLGGADKQSDPVAIVVTAMNMKVIDTFQGTVMFKQYMRTVTYISVTGAKKAPYFCYICKNLQLGLLQCCVFKFANKIPFELAEAVGKAFKLNEKIPNPFAPLAQQDLIKPPEALSKAEIRRQYLRSTAVVGAGQFGEVHLAELDLAYKNGQAGKTTTCAVKMLKGNAPDSHRDEFVRECEAMLELGHPNLCGIIGVSVRRKPWLCIIDYVRFGDVQSALIAAKHKNITVNLAEKLRICVQAAEGMAFMASKGWVHMDLAARNVLLDSDLVCKIADFGLTRRVGADGFYVQTTSMKLPVKWLALEVLEKRKFSEKSDVWALGITFWEIFTYGMTPYSGISNMNMVGELKKGTRLQRPRGCPDDVYNCFLKCWDASYELRPPFSHVALQLNQSLQMQGKYSVVFHGPAAFAGQPRNHVTVSKSG